MSIILQFPRSQYPSLQVGDIGYYAIMSTQSNGVNDFIIETGGFQTNDENEDFVEIGEILSIDNTTSLSDGTLTTSIEFDIDPSVELPTLIDFIFFSKNDKSNTGINTNVNKTSLLGYYAKARFRNTDSNKAEIYTVNTEVNESSK